MTLVSMIESSAKLKVINSVLTEARGLAPPAPGDVGSDEKGSPKPPKHSQEDKGNELKQVPRRVVLHVEQHQAAVPERVNGAQDEGRHQGSKEGAPQSFEWKVVTHLEHRQERFCLLNMRVII